MSRTLPVTNLVRTQRTHKLTDVHRAHVERVQKSKKRCASIHYNKNVRNGESSPVYTDDEGEDGGKNNVNAEDGATGEFHVFFNLLEDELNADEAHHQGLIKTLSKRKGRNDLANWDTDELEKLLALGSKAPKQPRPELKRFFDNSAKVVPNGPAREVVPPPKATLPKALSGAPVRKRSQSPSQDAQVARPPPNAQNRSSSRLGVARSEPPARALQQKSWGRSVSLRSQSQSNSAAPPQSALEDPDNLTDEDEDDDILTTDLEDNVDHATKASQKRKTERGRRSNFTGIELELVDLTFLLTLSHLFSKVPFLTTQQYTQCLLASWSDACLQLNLSRSRNLIQKCHQQSITNQISSFRSRVQDVAKDLCEVFFPYHMGKMTEQEIANKVASLLPNKMHQKPESLPGTGWFAHEWVERAVCKMFFMGCDPVAVKFPSEWDPVPPRAMAVMCGFMMYFLNKWKTSKFEKGGKQVINLKGKLRVKRMNFYNVEPFYCKQWTFMKRFGASPNQPGRRDVLLSNMYNSCLTTANKKRLDPEADSTCGDDSENKEDDFAMDIPTKEELSRVRRHKSISDDELRHTDESILDAGPTNLAGKGDTLDDREDLPDGDDLEGIGLGDLGDGDDTEMEGSPAARPCGGSPRVASLRPAVSACATSPARATAPEGSSSKSTAPNRSSSAKPSADSASGATGPKSAVKSTRKLEIVLPAKSKSAKPMDLKGPCAAFESGRLKVTKVNAR